MAYQVTGPGNKSATRPPEWLSLSTTEYSPPHTWDAFCRQPTEDWLHLAVLSAAPVGPLKDGPAVSMHPDKPNATRQNRTIRNIEPPRRAAIDRPPAAILIQPKSEIKYSGANLPY